MATTTIRLPDDLKARLKKAAERAGTNAHAFILDAVAEKTEQAERRNDFEQAAADRYAEIVATGMTIPWSKMRAYLEACAQGQRPRRPSARKLSR